MKRAQIVKTTPDEITFGHLDEQDKPALVGMMAGINWVTGDKDEGGFKTLSVFETPPTPLEDPIISPFWPASGNKTSTQGEMPLKIEKYASYGFTIQSLCGYNYTPERYKKVAGDLESWGFDCLRSRRGADGRYWEMWVLSGTWAAKGDLKEAIDKVGRSWEDSKPAMKAVIQFLCANSSFGTLDVHHQVAAMTIDD